jgi:hypothetical protein
MPRKLLKKFNDAIIRPEKNKEQLEFKDAKSAKAGLDRIRKDHLPVQLIDINRMKFNHSIGMSYPGVD